MNSYQNLMTKATTNFRKNLPNAASPLANSAVNIRLVATTVPIANEPICNENEETSVTEVIIRISLTEYYSSSWRETSSYSVPQRIIFTLYVIYSNNLNITI